MTLKQNHTTRHIENGAKQPNDSMAFLQKSDLPHVERPTDEDHLVHHMETCLVSYHFASSICLKHQGVFVFNAFREGNSEWRHSD